MKVLVTGANGQVAYELKRLCDEKKFSAYYLAKNAMDIADAESVREKFAEIKPALVINTAAYTQVDKAEENIACAYATNEKGAKNIALACEAKQIPLIHLSTDYIFDGSKQTPYVENDLVNPINIYGKSKLAGEEMVRAHCSKHIILRVSAVFGVHGANFVKTIMRLANEKEKLQIVRDQTICPTSAKAIAATVWQLAAMIKEIPAWGTYHFCGDVATNWFEFAKKIVANMKTKKTQQIDSIASQDYPVAATRPKYSVLDCSLLNKTFGIMPAAWQNDLTSVMTELTEQK